MPVILRQLPFATEPTVVAVGNEVVTIRPYQIVMWVSLTAANQNALSPAAVRFPAVLDTGFSHNFSMQERQVRSWASINPDVLTVARPARINRVSVPLVAAA